MTSNVLFMPKKTVALVTFPGAQVLDVTGPAAVFGMANGVLGRAIYDTRILSSTGGLIPLTGSVSIATARTSDLSSKAVHTLLVSGGDEDAVRGAIADAALGAWIARTTKTARRWGSVCSGTFVLASLGVLDGKRVATHWEGCARLERFYPKLSVDPEALYVVDGLCWTSAGVTTGIDMALEMVELDSSASVAASVAQRLVLYARRPGFQSQFSPLLEAQRRGDDPFRALITWMHDHLDEELHLEALAGRARQSVRDFHRKFRAATGRTPARFVEDLRLDRARALLGHGLRLQEIAEETGFGSAIRMSRAFERRFGIKPSLFRGIAQG